MHVITKLDVPHNLNPFLFSLSLTDIITGNINQRFEELAWVGSFRNE